MSSRAVVKLVGAGRPYLELDTTLIFDLARIHCTLEEIATICHCSDQTLLNNYLDVIKDGRASGRASLRRKQVQMAMEGNGTMLVWLGKQLLAQRDQIDARIGNPDGTAFGTPKGIEPATPEQAEASYLRMIHASAQPLADNNNGGGKLN